MVLRYGGTETTKDLDVLSPADDIVLEMAVYAARGSALHSKTGVYLDVVAPIHPIAPGTRDRAKRIPIDRIARLEIRVLDPVDLIITKVQSYRAGDQEDIAQLTRSPDFDPYALLERWSETRVDYKGETVQRDMDARVNELIRMFGIQPIDWSEDY